MDIAFEIANTINNITLYDHNDGDYEYNDLCTRSVPNQPHCDSAADSFFGVFFQNNEALWKDMNTTLQIVNSPGAPIDRYLGGYEYAEDDPTQIIGANALRIVYSLRGSTNETVKGAAK